MDIAFSTIKELRKALDDRQVSAVELAKFFLARIKKFEPQLHAFITITEEEALKQADEADEAIAKGEQSMLTGIPYAAKDNYSTNVPREDVERDDVFLAFELEDKPIPREHGYIRLIIPHLYAWKTSKFLTEIEFSEKDKPGFWEVRGYNNHGDAFKEERYS